jgi:hypothetical protein
LYGLQSNKKKRGSPLHPEETKGVFSKVVLTYEGLGELFGGEFEDKCIENSTCV